MDLHADMLLSMQGQLRAQLLSQLQKGQLAKVEGPPGDKPSLKRKALNHLISDYLGASSYQYSLSVFGEEANVSGAPLMTEDEILELLHIDKTSTLFHALVATKQRLSGSQGDSFLLRLVEAVAEVGHSGRGAETGTQTSGGDRYHLEVSRH